MKLLVVFFALLFTAAPATIYTFKLTDLDGKAFDLKKYKGKKILIVNTASQCGFTHQYTDLQKLSQTYGDKLVVIGFPANNFGGQEPGTAAEIKEFCTGTGSQYHVTFPLMEKSSVKGADISPLFKYLTEAPNPDFTGDIKWNFEKFLIDENGTLIHRFRSATEPMSADITKYL